MKFLSLLTFVLVASIIVSAHKSHKKKDDYNEEAVRQLKIASKSEKINLNSIGEKVAKNVKINLRSFPFIVERCDQVVEFKGEYISDMGDYRKRSSGFFTITAHYLNLFSSNKPDQLIKSLLLSDAKEAPKFLKGTGYCILVKGKREADNMTICLKLESERNNILAVFKSFLDCQGKLEADPAKILIPCQSGGSYMNPRELLNHLKKKLQKKEKRVVRKAADFFHPGSDDIPGIPGTGNRDVHLDPGANPGNKNLAPKLAQ